jgi:hypothetical protein
MESVLLTEALRAQEASFNRQRNAKVRRACIADQLGRHKVRTVE